MAQLLAAAAGGLALGVIAAVLGYAELAHRRRFSLRDQAKADVIAAPRPVRGRW